MSTTSDTPLLLLDNSAMMSVINQGDYRCTNLSFEEAKAVLDMHGDYDVIKCFSDSALEEVIFNYLGITPRDYPYKKIRFMKPSQEAIVFKLYITPSETQPVINVDGIEAKKIQNVYVYCQFIARYK